MDNKGISLLQKLLVEVKQEIIDIGGCDHSVYICCCHLKYLVEDTDKYLLNLLIQKCSICKKVILLDQSYIQNCDGVQHVDCYFND